MTATTMSADSQSTPEQAEQIAATDVATSETPKRRAEDVGYIDDAATEFDGETVNDDGSSVEEESDVEEGGWPLEESEFLGPFVAPEEEDEEDLDWGVENEDWELADGGW